VTAPPFRDRLYLRFQRLVSLAFFPATALAVVAWLRLVRGYTVRDAERVRRRFRDLVGKARSPVLVCSNHLTLIDSILLAWSLGRIRDYLRRFSLFPWSLPEKANFAGRPLWKVAAFLGKCVYVTRGGPREEVKRALARIAYLLRSGEMVSIFPGGGRSRTGRVDTRDFQYGVGQLLQLVPGTRVLLVYLRGTGQESWSDYPRKGEEFHVDLQVLQPESQHSGLRGARDLATQIVFGLSEMEARYFADRQRPR
jgi:1-acyl-sn-glycerol-3-phosphate acyltransferase